MNIAPNGRESHLEGSRQGMLILAGSKAIGVAVQQVTCEIGYYLHSSNDKEGTGLVGDLTIAIRDKDDNLKASWSVDARTTLPHTHEDSMETNDNHYTVVATFKEGVALAAGDIVYAEYLGSGDMTAENTGHNLRLMTNDHVNWKVYGKGFQAVRYDERMSEWKPTFAKADGSNDRMFMMSFDSNPGTSTIIVTDGSLSTALSYDEITDRKGVSGMVIGAEPNDSNGEGSRQGFEILAGFPGIGTHVQEVTFLLQKKDLGRSDGDVTGDLIIAVRDKDDSVKATWSVDAKKTFPDKNVLTTVKATFSSAVTLAEGDFIYAEYVGSGFSTDKNEGHYLQVKTNDHEDWSVYGNGLRAVKYDETEGGAGWTPSFANNGVGDRMFMAMFDSSPGVVKLATPLLGLSNILTTKTYDEIAGRKSVSTMPICGKPRKQQLEGERQGMEVMSGSAAIGTVVAQATFYLHYQGARNSAGEIVKGSLLRGDLILAIRDKDDNIKGIWKANAAKTFPQSGDGSDTQVVAHFNPAVTLAEGDILYAEYTGSGFDKDAFGEAYGHIINMKTNDHVNWEVYGKGFRARRYINDEWISSWSTGDSGRGERMFMMSFDSNPGVVHTTDVIDGGIRVLVRSPGGAFFGREGVYECAYTMSTSKKVLTVPAVLIEGPKKGSVHCPAPVQDPNDTVKDKWSAAVQILELGHAMPALDNSGNAIKDPTMWFGSEGPAIAIHGENDGKLNIGGKGVIDNKVTVLFSVTDSDSTDANITVAATAVAETWITDIEFTDPNTAGMRTMVLTLDANYDGEPASLLTLKATDDHDRVQSKMVAFAVLPLFAPPDIDGIRWYSDMDTLNDAGNKLKDITGTNNGANDASFIEGDAGSLTFLQDGGVGGGGAYRFPDAGAFFSIPANDHTLISGKGARTVSLYVKIEEGRAEEIDDLDYPFGMGTVCLHFGCALLHQALGCFYSRLPSQIMFTS
jgi:hypothetical protein